MVQEGGTVVAGDAEGVVVYVVVVVVGGGGGVASRGPDGVAG